MKQRVTEEKNYIGPFIFMVILMALIGFITGINQQFQEPLKNTFLAEAGSAKNTLSTLLIFAFFSAYFVMGPVVARFLNRVGYKRTLLRGILLVAVAMLVFELSVLVYKYVIGTPFEWINHLSIFGSVIPLSFFIFIIGSFISGTGLTYLQASVNPYIVVCTVPNTTGVTRQNIAGVGNSLMNVLAPLFVAYVIFGGQRVQTLSVDAMILPFLLLFVVLILLLGGVSRVELPHLEGTTAEDTQNLTRTVLRYRHLVLGAIALGVYVGCEVCIGANIVTAWGDGFRAANPDATDIMLKEQYAVAARWSAIYWGGMLLGRFLSSFLSRVSAQAQLAVATAIAAMLVLLSMVVGDLRILVFVGLFHAVMWGAIFSLALEGLGKYTAAGSGILLMGLLGGAILPLLQGIWADSANSWQYSWILVLAGELYMLYYALWGHRVVHPIDA